VSEHEHRGLDRTKLERVARGASQDRVRDDRRLRDLLADDVVQVDRRGAPRRRQLRAAGAFAHAASSEKNGAA